MVGDVGTSHPANRSATATPGRGNRPRHRRTATGRHTARIDRPSRAADNRRRDLRRAIDGACRGVDDRRRGLRRAVDGAPSAAADDRRRHLRRAIDRATSAIDDRRRGLRR
ncbi:MAG TPA: hypothetical protein VNT55_23930, partial [Baekduia sp.]|nr:hypothetical protein [Baekduia sp.]